MVIQSCFGKIFKHLLHLKKILKFRDPKRRQKTCQGGSEERAQKGVQIKQNAQNPMKFRKIENENRKKPNVVTPCLA